MEPIETSLSFIFDCKNQHILIRKQNCAAGYKLALTGAGHSLFEVSD